jgi:hypothetical protein
MNLIKITTKEENLVKNYMNDVMSFDEGLFEIIVGWDLAKERGANILNHEINKNTYWTFSLREKRKVFEENFKAFTQKILTDIIKDVKINNINPLHFNNQQEYLKFLKKNIQGCDGYLYVDRLYVYCGNLIYHIDILLLQFLNWEIVTDIKNLITLKENKEIPKTLKDFDIKYIPYLNGKKSDIIGDFHRL